MKHAIDIEKKHFEILPELSLSDAIGRESPVLLRNIVARLVAALVVSDPRYRTDKVFHSDAKIEFFYKSIVLLFAIVFLAVLFFGGITVNGGPIIHYAKSAICNL